MGFKLMSWPMRPRKDRPMTPAAFLIRFEQKVFVTYKLRNYRVLLHLHDE